MMSCMFGDGGRSSGQRSDSIITLDTVLDSYLEIVAVGPQD